MVMDMPPGQAVEYRLEAPAPRALSTNGIDNLLRLARAKRDVSRASGGDVERVLPAIDPASKALSGADRKAMAEGITAGPYGRISDVARDAPASYVGDRVRLAALRAQALEQSFQGNLKMEQAEAIRCRTIAIAMDRRAGAYVVGGERTAEQARKAISPEAIAKCRETVARHTQHGGPQHAAVGISPDRSRPVAAGLQRVDLAASPRQRIDPVGSVRQRIDSVPSVKHRLDLTSPGRGG